jgi:hypothetical protein
MGREKDIETEPALWSQGRALASQETTLTVSNLESKTTVPDGRAQAISRRRFPGTVHSFELNK